MKTIFRILLAGLIYWVNDESAFYFMIAFIPLTVFFAHLAEQADIAAGIKPFGSTN